MYKQEEAVFVKNAKVKGIVKEIDQENKKYKVTFFKRQKNGESKRITAWFDEQSLAKWRVKNQSNKNVRKTLKDYGNKHYYQVRRFHKVFNHPVAYSPQELSETQIFNRGSWIVEEVIELLHATAGNNEKFESMYNELLSKIQSTYQKQLEKPYPENKLVAQVDGFADILYFGNGGFVELGVKPDRVFSCVHKSNMKKIWPDGKPHYNEDGKVVKPEGWQPPERFIEKEIERQKFAAQKRKERLNKQQ
jgi:predicted HAD superfamily Cof-like phosphohydrolase